MALNPIVFTEKVVRSFLRYLLTAYPFADEDLHTQMRQLLSLDQYAHIDKRHPETVEEMIENHPDKPYLQELEERVVEELHDLVEILLSNYQVMYHPYVEKQVENQSETGQTMKDPR